MKTITLYATVEGDKEHPTQFDVNEATAKALVNLTDLPWRLEAIRKSSDEMIIALGARVAALESNNRVDQNVELLMEPYLQKPHEPGEFLYQTQAKARSPASWPACPTCALPLGSNACPTCLSAEGWSEAWQASSQEINDLDKHAKEQYAAYEEKIKNLEKKVELLQLGHDHSMKQMQNALNQELQLMRQADARASYNFEVAEGALQTCRVAVAALHPYTKHNPGIETCIAGIVDFIGKHTTSKLAAPSKEWCDQMAKLEQEVGGIIGAGVPHQFVKDNNDGSDDCGDCGNSVTDKIHDLGDTRE